MDRRQGTTPDDGHRRRDTDRMADFALLREKILLGLGSLIVGGFSVAAVFGTIHSIDIALACLGIGTALLGSPIVMRWDESRRSK